MIQKRKNTKTKKILLGLLLGVIALGAIGYGTYQVLNEENPVVEIEKSGVSETIESRGVKVRLLSTRTLENDVVEKTFSYSVEPSNATNKEIKVTSAYVDGSDSSQVITTSVDSLSQTITVVCNGPFKQKIKKIESIDGTITSLHVGNGWDVNFEGAHIDTTVTYADFITPTYSDFTKDKQYTFAMKDIHIISDEFLIQGSLPDQDTDELYTELTVMLYDAFNNQGALPTTEDMWNAVDSDAYRSWLLSVADLDPWSDDAYLCLEVQGTIYCVEDPTISVQIGGGTHFYVYFSFQGDYSDYKVGVDSISVEQTEIDF